MPVTEASVDTLPAQSGQELIDALIATVSDARATVAALQALEAAAMNAALRIADERAREGSASRRAADLEVRQIAAEFAAALRVSDRTIQAQMSDASQLVDRFPAVHTALAAGRISRAHARIIVDAGIPIDDETARGDFERAALAAAEVESPGRLRPIARMLAARIEPRRLTERHREAREGRAVVVRDLDDGMSDVIATVPTLLAHGIHDRLTTFATAVRDADLEGDDRSMDQRRADVLCDLLLAGAPAAVGSVETAASGITAHVQVVIPARTLAGLSDDPADLTGVGPLDAQTARLIAGATPAWSRVFADAETGMPCAVDRYRPSAEITRLLQARDPHCRFPGCRMPAWRCDLDHTVDAQHGGQTACCNLAHMCRRHHTLKHATRWGVRQLDGGVLEWTSPGGAIYLDAIPSPVAFAVTAPPGRGDPWPNVAGPGDPPPF